MAKPFFHHRQHILVAAAFGEEEPVGAEPRLGQAGCKQIAVPHRPEHRSRRVPPRRNPGHEQPGRSLVAGSRPFPRHFMQRGGGQAPALKPPVDRIEPEGQMRPGSALPVRFDRAHGRPQGGKALGPEGRRSRHHSESRLICSLYVPIMPGESQPERRTACAAPRLQNGPLTLA